MSISQVLNCLFVCVGKFSVAKVQNKFFLQAFRNFFFSSPLIFFAAFSRHAANKKFVLIAKQRIARCSCE